MSAHTVPLSDSDDWMERPACTRCRCCDLELAECPQCDAGYSFPGELHDADPLWYDPDDVEPCGLCGGEGGWRVCAGSCDEQGVHSWDRPASPPTP